MRTELACRAGAGDPSSTNDLRTYRINPPVANEVCAECARKSFPQSHGFLNNILPSPPHNTSYWLLVGNKDM